MLTKEFPWSEAPGESHRARHFAAGALRAVSVSLAVLARRLGAARRPKPRMDPVLEFYAEAGAPEGALYVDGKLVGWVAGVNRL